MKQKRNDLELMRQVARELRWDTRIGLAPVKVDVEDAVATLTGSVSSYAQKLAAQEAAHRVVGVLDVANDIEVKSISSTAPTDTQIAQAVRRALEWDALVPNEQIRSTVSNGWVTLEGEVDYWREREDAERTILRLNGVVGVLNEITIRNRSVDPEDLREQIENALECRADREANRFRVEIHDGKVDLHGRVHSWQEKRAVLGSVRHAPGVTEVSDHLRIDPYF
jgi:osmotically-inducible protein OsmY